MTLKLLCNENIPAAVITALRAEGHDVVAIGETSPGLKDRDVLAIALSQERICLTFDKDFGELAARHPAAAKSGVILLRLPAGNASTIGARIPAILARREDWPGHFSVVEAGRVRMRRL